MFQQFTLLTVAVSLIAATGCKRPMTEFTSTEYKFKASFPSKPTEQEQTASGIKFKMFATESKNGAYMVWVADIPIPANESDAMLQQRLDGARDGAIKNVGGTQKSSSASTLAGKYPGREFSAGITQPTEGLLRARIYLVGTRLYQVMVIGIDSYANSSEATAFLNSFKLTE